VGFLDTLFINFEGVGPRGERCRLTWPVWPNLVMGNPKSSLKGGMLG
jgi:hypothetical protein